MSRTHGWRRPSRMRFFPSSESGQRGTGTSRLTTTFGWLMK
jgi:hypothetical protein